MIRKVIATTALTGALALGVGGVASAASTTPPAGGTATATHTFNCARAPRVLARIAKLEARAQAFIPKAQAREATAQKNGNTTRANKIAARITRVQGLEARAATLQQKVEATCPGAVPAAPGGASTS